MLRSVWNNKGTLLLAFILALTIWALAINESDPVIEDYFSAPIRIDYQNLADGLMLVGQPPQECILKIRAPRSVWDALTTDDIQIEVDLAGLDNGSYEITLGQPVITRKPVMVTELSPSKLWLTIEAIETRTLPISIQITGEPALGYEALVPVSDPEQVTLTGPLSVISSISEIQAVVDINGHRQDYSQVISPTPLDQGGYPLSDVSMTPAEIHVTVPIQQGERYRLVAVIPIITGQPKFGYRITKIDVIPEQVIVFSSDPTAFESLQGYVETEPIEITDAVEPVELRASLSLPEGIALVGDQTILIQVGIEAIENSMTLTRPIEIQGLELGLTASTSPSSVTVFLTGPLPTLEGLKPEDVHVVLDLLDLEVGTYQLTPQLIFPPTDVEGTILPAIIEVTITIEVLNTSDPE